MKTKKKNPQTWKTLHFYCYSADNTDMFSYENTFFLNEEEK